MTIDYALLTLPCWTCSETFLTFTELSNHHLAMHAKPLPSQAVPPEDCPVCHHRIAILPGCCRCGAHCAACDAFQQARDVWDLTAPRCRECEAPVPDVPDHLRLQLCAICAARGCLAYCATCGENHPEHGLGGKGCAVWVAPQNVPPTEALADTPVPEDCPVCRHEYPMVLYCTRCAPDCHACAVARAAIPSPFSGLRRMWQVGVEGDLYNDHVENSVCAVSKCVPIEENAP